MRKRGIVVFEEVGMAVIPLGGRTEGAPSAAIIDAADADIVAEHNWYPKLNTQGTHWYVTTSVPDENGKGRHVRLHRMILDAADDMVVDHINHNTLDNRRSNLR